MIGSTVVVLGAAGFIGRHAALALAKRGCYVIGIGHGDWSAEQAKEFGIQRWINANISLETLKQIQVADSIQCVIHCGGSGAVAYSYDAPFDDFYRAALTTASVLEWIRTANYKECRFVLVSSAAVYGNQGNVDATEQTSRSPVSPYGVHKVSAELLCESYAQFFNVKSSIVRLFSVYGDGLQKQLMWDALKKFQKNIGDFFGTGNEIRDWIHVNDASELLASAGLVKQSNFEVYNGGGEHATTSEVLLRLANEYGYTRPICFDGHEHKGNPARLTSAVGNAKILLNWTPSISLDEGVRNYVSWFKSQ